MPEQLPLIAEERIEPTLRMVEVERIVFTEHPYAERFGESIRAHGVFQSVILVQTRGREATYEVIDGRRRVKAAQAAGMTRVPALVYPPNTPSSLLDEITVEANVHRSGNPIAEMFAIHAMMRDGTNTVTIARRLGMTVRAVEQRMRMIGLPTALLDAIEAGRLKVSVAKQILGLAPETRVRLRQLYEDRQVLELGGESYATITLHDVREARNWEQSQAPVQTMMFMDGFDQVTPTEFEDSFTPQTAGERAVADLSAPQSTLQGMLGVDLTTGEDRTVVQRAVAIARGDNMEAGVWLGPDNIRYYDQSWVNRERARIALFEPNDLTVIPIRPAEGHPLGVFIEPDGELFYTEDFMNTVTQAAVERRLAAIGAVVIRPSEDVFGRYVAASGEQFVSAIYLDELQERLNAIDARLTNAQEELHDQFERVSERVVRGETNLMAVADTHIEPVHEESWQNVVARLEQVREVMPASPDDESDRVATVFEFLLGRARELARA